MNRSEPRPLHGQLTRSWRVTTAARVFVLALATGQTLTTGTLPAVAIILVALATLGAVTCVLELEPHIEARRWTSLAEGVVAAGLLGSTDAPVAPLLIYLAVPPLVAGIRHGWVSAVNATAGTGLALVGAWVAASSLQLAAPQIADSAPWVIIGCGAGLLAAGLTRSGRVAEENRAPYAAAHRLLSRLHSVSQQLPGGLDSRTVAQQLVDDVHLQARAERTVIFIRPTQQVLVPLATVGTATALDEAAEERLGEQCLTERRRVRENGRLALLLRIGDHEIGTIVVSGTDLDGADLAAVEATLEEQGLGLDTALLFDDVRAIATTEERNRLARDIHDGVAQEVASLGYLVDDLAATCTEPAAREAADALRREVTRVVGELRLSIFDLRNHVEQPGGLTEALGSYVRELASHTGLRVHLRFDEHGSALPPDVASALLRIGQEAVANVRKHAEANNLWVTLSMNGGHARLQIEDDGRGSARPRHRHYGLFTMRERAESIHADFHIGARSGGGTVVTVQTQTIFHARQSDDHADRRASG